jgi:hypothetical protein
VMTSDGSNWIREAYVRRTFFCGSISDMRATDQEPTLLPQREDVFAKATVEGTNTTDIQFGPTDGVLWPCQKLVTVTAVQRTKYEIV